MSITNAKYRKDGSITATFDGIEMTIPVDPGNRHYVELISSGVDIVHIDTPSIEYIRSIKFISKSMFCEGLIALDILTADEAVIASRGQWPPSMDSFLSYLSPIQAASVQIEWATAARVYRTNEFVLILGSWIDDITPEILDTLFGIG
jgi:hypothetical protein